MKIEKWQVENGIAKPVNYFSQPLNPNANAIKEYYSDFDDRFKELHSGIDRLVIKFGWKEFFFACIRYQKAKVKSLYKIVAPK